MQQRGFAFTGDKDDRDMGEEVRNSGSVFEDQKYVTVPRCGTDRNEHMGKCDGDAVEAIVSESRTWDENRVEHESGLSGSWPREKVQQLTPIRSKWLQAYLKTGSPTETAKAMGVRNTKEVSRRITTIARQLGFSTAAEMKEAAGVMTPRTQTANHSQLMQLLQTQEFCCALSGQVLSPTTARLDHKVAVSRGGAHDISNLQWVTDEVNRAKGTMSNDQFIAVCKCVASWAK